MGSLVLETEHFSASELVCPCGDCAPGMDRAFMELLESIRRLYGRPMLLSSAHRCSRYNLKVSATGADGPHTKRRAVDVLVFGVDAYRLIAVAINEGITGIGVNQKGPHSKRFIHLDNLKAPPRPWIWSY